MRRVQIRLLAALLGACFVVPAGFSAAPAMKPDRILVLPGGGHALDLDDMLYFSALDRVVVPSAQAGGLVFINPATGAVSSIQVTAPKGDAGGTASAALAGDYLFTADTTAGEIATVDLRRKTVVGRARLAGEADYVRYSATNDELWVTEPREAGRIEYFRIQPGEPVRLAPGGTISVPGGPESLVLEAAKGLAYTNTFGDQTLMIDVRTHRVLETWSNGCGAYTKMARGARGLALDATAHILYVACMQGRVVGLDIADHGKVVTAADAAPGVDMIAFNARTRHLFAPSKETGRVTVFDAQANGALKRIAEYHAARGSHCVISNDTDKIYVCDPKHGQVFEITDRSVQH